MSNAMEMTRMVSSFYVLSPPRAISRKGVRLCSATQRTDVGNFSLYSERSHSNFGRNSKYAQRRNSLLVKAGRRSRAEDFRRSSRPLSKTRGAAMFDLWPEDDRKER